MTRPRARWRVTIGGLVLAVFLPAGLATSAQATAAPSPSAPATSAQLVAPKEAARVPADARSDSSGFPVTVTSGGTKARLDKKPLRILCLSPSSTQMLYAIGAGDQVVAVDKYSTYPPQAPRTSLTGYETTAEDYLRYRPDLVLLAFQEGSMVQQLAKLHIPALVLPPATTMASAYAQVTELGQATGHDKGAASVIASLRQHLASAEKTVGDAAKGKTYYVELSPQDYTATSATFIGAEFSLFGMRNAADKAGHGDAYPQISAEYLLAQDPDYVFLADTVCCHVTPATFSHRPGFSVLSAVKDHQVVGVNDSVASQWGPHTIEEFVTLLAHVLRP